MSKSSGSFGLSLESVYELVVRHKLRSDDLECDRAFGAEVSSAKDCSHSALTEELFDAVLLVDDLAFEIGESAQSRLMGGRVEKALLSGFFIRSNQRLDFVSERGVARAGEI